MFTIAVKQYGEEGNNTENKNEDEDEDEDEKEKKNDKKDHIENESGKINECQNKDGKEINMKETKKLSGIAENLNFSEDEKERVLNVKKSDITTNIKKSEILSNNFHSTVKIEINEKINEVENLLIPKMKIGR